jgi:hypothetical protein
MASDLPIGPWGSSGPPKTKRERMSACCTAFTCSRFPEFRALRSGLPLFTASDFTSRPSCRTSCRCPLIPWSSRTGWPIALAAGGAVPLLVSVPVLVGELPAPLWATPRSPARAGGGQRKCGHPCVHRTPRLHQGSPGVAECCRRPLQLAWRRSATGSRSFAPQVALRDSGACRLRYPGARVRRVTIASGTEWVESHAREEENERETRFRQDG